MIVLKEKVKAWLGPLWWYSAILFCVQRLGDLTNAFIGLYLVPRYVPQAELGALLPLTQVGGALGLPLTVLMITFSKYVNTYATRGEYGKVKNLLRDVFTLSAILFVAAMLYARFFMPMVFERMRVSDGRLGMLVVVSGVLGALASIFTNALQALKKFRMLASIGLFSAPLRLATLLICLPIRALSGYFMGQLVPTIYSIGVAVYGLRDLFSSKIKGESYLRQDGLNLLKYAAPVTIGLLLGTLQTLIESFVIRHRLPDMESAGYYMISRFAEVGTYVGSTIILVLFPLASEQHERDDRSQKLVIQGMGLSLAGGAGLAFIFLIAGRHLLNLVAAWRTYVDFVPHLTILTVISALRITANCFAVHEMACRRFRYLTYMGAISLLEVTFLYSVTGYSFFEPWVPVSWIRWMADLKAARLEFILGVMFWSSILPLVFMIVQLAWQRRQRTHARVLNG